MIYIVTFLRYLVMTALCNTGGHYIFVPWFLPSFLFFFFPRLIPAIAYWMSTILPRMAPSHNFVGLYLRNWGLYWQPEKNLLNTDTSSTWPHNMVNFGLLMAEIRWRVWGTPADFNGFRVLAALLHGTLVV